MKTIFGFALLFLSLNFSFAQEKNYTADETNISSANGDAFTISLDANKTTGYSWSALVSDTTVLMIEGYDYVVQEPKRLGKGGQEIWRFRGVSPGNVTVLFNYSRPWEKDVPAAKTVTFNVSVK